MREIKMTGRDSIKSVEKCFRLLNFIYISNQSLTLEEFVKLSGYKKTSCFRLLKTMVKVEILEQDHKNKTYQFGLNLVSIGLSAIKNMSLLKISSPILQKLRNETGETVNLSILNGTEILFIERLMSNHIVNLNRNVGDRLSVHCASMGKVILAFMDESITENILNKLNFEAMTKNTFTNLGSFKNELKKIKQKGYAYNNEELEMGLRAVAAPIFNHTGEVIAAINLAWTTARHPSKKSFQKFTPKILEAAKRISFLMGYCES